MGRSAELMTNALRSVVQGISFFDRPRLVTPLRGTVASQAFCEAMLKPLEGDKWMCMYLFKHLGLPTHKAVGILAAVHGLTSRMEPRWDNLLLMLLDHSTTARDAGPTLPADIQRSGLSGKQLDKSEWYSCYSRVTLFRARKWYLPNCVCCRCDVNVRDVSSISAPTR